MIDGIVAGGGLGVQRGRKGLKVQRGLFSKGAGLGKGEEEGAAEGTRCRVVYRDIAVVIIYSLLH